MGISSLYQRFVRASYPPSADSDVLLDRQIRAVLLADAAVQPPAWAWNRLRRAIIDRRLVHSRGMWILDEPLRDPPESLPTTLSCQQFERALRIYNSRGYCRYRVRETTWNNWMPSFVAVFNA